MSAAHLEIATSLSQASARPSRYRQSLALAVLAPIVAELLSGSAPPTAFLVPWVFALFVLLYGTAVLLIRELSMRSGGGWMSILLMGGAFGILQEGCGTRAFFDPAWRSLGPLAGVGRWAGVNWIWTADAILYHAAFSTALPILLVYQLFPATTKRPWLKRGELFVISVLFSGALSILVSAGSKYQMSPVYLVACVMVAFLLIAAAQRRPRSSAVVEPTVSVSPKRFAALGAIVTVGQVFQVYFAPQLGGGLLSFGLLVILVITSWRLLRSWTARGQHWSRAQQYGLLAGALGSFAVMDFFQEFNPTRVDNMRGVSLVGATALGCLFWMGRRLRQPAREG